MEIIDLCGALKQHDDSQPCLGYIRDDKGRCHTVQFPANDVIPTSRIRQVVTLNTLLTQRQSSTVKLPRRSRLIIALIMAQSLLKLHGSPWLKDAWGKQDIYFFETHGGEVQAGHPLLASNFSPSNPSPAITSRSKGPARNNARFLFCVLEFWFLSFGSIRRLNHARFVTNFSALTAMRTNTPTSTRRKNGGNKRWKNADSISITSPDDAYIVLSEQQAKT